ncbi:MAG: hypothetical protein FWB98_07970, partial [Defluviitaleaceae bacterium]|nr:hypothetical protein [Defluviitaleaceae bacterium]
ERKKGLGGFDTTPETILLTNVANLSLTLMENLTQLESALSTPEKTHCLLASMSGLRQTVDAAETTLPRKNWPLPTYANLFSSVV